MPSQNRLQPLLLASGFIRAFCTGLIGVLIAVMLSRRNFSPPQIGLIVSLGLSGIFTYGLLVTTLSRAIRIKPALQVLSLMTLLGGMLLLYSTDPLIVAIAAFFGMLNGMGRDRGPSVILEHSILPLTTTDSSRTKVFAWYNILQDSGAALGAAAVGLPALFGLPDSIDSDRLLLWLYIGFSAIGFLLYLFLPALPVPSGSNTGGISVESKKKVFRISSLFLIDSIAGGILTSALISFFFFERFGVPISGLGLLFFTARGLNALSHLGAAALAKRIGLVNTMVFTHIPSSLFLITAAFAPNLTVAIIFFLLRESLVEMDVPTRQSYVMAIVSPAERTFASGVTTLVRSAGWAIGPLFASALMTGNSLAVPLATGAALKIGYDILLYRSFIKIKPPEEALTT
jgi:MFS family permease